MQAVRHETDVCVRNVTFPPKTVPRDPSWTTRSVHWLQALQKFLPLGLVLLVSYQSFLAQCFDLGKALLQ